MKNKIYIIDGKTYLNHINDEVHLYGLLHQLAFLAGRIKDEEDVFHVLDAAKRYGEIAEEKFLHPLQFQIRLFPMTITFSDNF